MVVALFQKLEASCCPLLGEVLLKRSSSSGTLGTEKKGIYVWGLKKRKKWFIFYVTFYVFMALILVASVIKSREIIGLFIAPRPRRKQGMWAASAAENSFSPWHWDLHSEISLPSYLSNPLTILPFLKKKIFFFCFPKLTSQLLINCVWWEPFHLEKWTLVCSTVSPPAVSVTSFSLTESAFNQFLVFEGTPEHIWKFSIVT